MAKFQLIVLFVISTVAFATNTVQKSTSLSYRKWSTSNLELVEGQQVNLPVKGGRCKPIGELDVSRCSGTIDKTTFSKLSELKILKISESQINSIKCDSFSSFKKLEKVVIEQSSVHFNIETGLAGRAPLSYFTELSCSNSVVSGVTRNAFSDLSFVKKISVESSTLNCIGTDIFDDLISVKELSITSSAALDLDLTVLSKLSSLEYLALHQVQSNVKIDYNIFQSLSNLKTIRFDTSVYQQLNFEAFSSLKTVEIVKNDITSFDVDSLVKNLSGRGIDCVYV